MKNGIASHENEESFENITVTESMHGLAPYSLTVDRRRANAVIEKSSFPGANVSSTIEKQENHVFNNCTFHYDKTNTESAERNDREFGSPPPETYPQTRFHIAPSPDQLHSSSRKLSHAFDNDSYTKVSEKIYFYNIQPLRKRSRVYLGKQKHASNNWRDVAVKLVPHTERNLREIEFLLNLEGHSNIVKIIESHEIFGHIREIYIAMELCSQNLREYISSVKDKPVNFDTHASYSKQLVNGLAYIHSNRIIHGDLKPDNILFSQNMKYIKISDFGLSEEAFNEKDAPNTSSSLPGTEGYRAPEIYFDPPELTFASDIFSIGIVIFYLLTIGCHPFGDKPHDWGFNIRYSRNRDMSLLYQLPILPSVKLSIFDLIGSSLRTEASRRPTANTMLWHVFFGGVPCEIQVLDSDEMQASLQRSISATNGQPREEDKILNAPVNEQTPSERLIRSHKQTSFTSTVSSQSSLYNRSHLSSEASIQQRLDDLEFQVDSMKRLLDSKTVNDPNRNSDVFNSYPRSANLQYPSEISQDDASIPEDENASRCATTSRIPVMKQSLPDSYSKWLNSHRIKPLTRQASLKVKSSFKTETPKDGFKRSDSFSYDRFQGSQLTAANEASTQQLDSSSPALPERTSKKQSKISKLRKIFKKKEK